MTSSLSPSTIDSLRRVAEQTPGLELCLLFGSRARADAHAGSDWDLGYRADDRFDPAAFLGPVVETVGTDRVDLVNLARAGGLLRYRAARDGQLLYEARPHMDEQFRLEAVQFWCDASPVLERGYEDVLADLTR